MSLACTGRNMYYMYSIGNQIMAKAKQIKASAGDIVRQFSHYSDVALKRPVIVTKNGRPRNVLISVEEYDRLKSRDQLAFTAENSPEEFIADLEAYLHSRNR
jgi:prevent-host-death family protein